MNLLLKSAACSARSLAPAVVEANTLVASNLALPEWSYTDEILGVAAIAVFARLATAAEGGNERDEYVLNATLANTTDWYLGNLIQVPAGATGLTISCEVKRVSGDVSGNVFALAVLNEAGSAWLPTHAQITPTGSWSSHSHTVTASLGSVRVHAILIAHTAFGRSGLTRVLVRNVKVSPVGASGVFSGTYYRLGAAGNLRGDTRAAEIDTTGKRQRQDAQARYELQTTATKWGVELRASIYPQYTTQAKALVTVDSTTVSQPAVTAKTQPELTTGTMAAGKKQFRAFAPLAAYNPTRVELQHGELRAIYLNDPKPLLLRRPSRRFYLLGDSITAGWSATVPQYDSWASILRDSYHVDVCVDGVGSRQLKDLELQSATPGFAQTGWAHHAARAASWGATDVVVALGVNDWGLYGATVTYTAAQYGAALAAFAAAIHAALPFALVWVVSPLFTTLEGTTNTNGETLANFRTAAGSALSSLAYATHVDGSTLVTLAGLTGDGVHPNNTGHETIADNLALELGL